MLTEGYKPTHLFPGSRFDESEPTRSLGMSCQPHARQPTVPQVTRHPSTTNVNGDLAQSQGSCTAPASLVYGNWILYCQYDVCIAEKISCDNMTSMNPILKSWSNHQNTKPAITRTTEWLHSTIVYLQLHTVKYARLDFASYIVQCVF